MHLVIYAVVILIGGGLFFFYQNHPLHAYFLIGAILLCWQSGFEAYLEINRSNLNSGRYGLLSSMRAIIYLGTGTLFVWLGGGGKGLLFGLLLGYFVPSLIGVFRIFSVYRFSDFDKEIFLKITKYGIPLSATFLLTFVIDSSDRLIIGWLIDSSAAGVYSAGYDLSSNSLVLLMSIVNLAAYPLAVRALEHKGIEESKRQIEANGTLLFATSIPAAVLMIILADNITYIALGVSFQKMGSLLMPWIVISALIMGIKAFHFDLSFQLGQKTIQQVYIALVSALGNFILNIWLITKFGIIGAAYSTLISYLVGLVFSWFLGRRIFTIPVPWFELLKVICASLIMTISVWQLADLQGLHLFIIQATIGVTSYAFSAIMLNIGGCRKLFVYRILNAK
jgi:O-antigen/teichoic acid export membrane protein